MSTELRELIAAATPGPWSVWREKCHDRWTAIHELTEQVQTTDPFIGALYLLNANGKCPATTGCGPTSEANAALIVAAVNALPALLDELDTLRARVREAEDAWKTAAEMLEKAIALRSRLDEAKGHIKALLSHMGIADAAPEDIDGEDRMIESRARAFMGGNDE